MLLKILTIAITNIEITIINYNPMAIITIQLRITTITILTTIN